MVTLVKIEQDINPFPTYRRMRAEQPVFYDPERGNWNIFRYDDVQRVLSDYKTFSSQFTGGSSSQPAGEPFSASMISTDPPRHRQLRGLVSQAFTPRAVEDLAPRILDIVTQELDLVKDQDEIDIIRDLAVPLPVTVIADLLGVPVTDRAKFKEWSDIVVSFADLGGNVAYEGLMANQAVLEMSMYFFNMIEQRRHNPGKDLISGLLQASLDGQKLSEIELLGFCALLLVAGNETTTNLIGNAMLTFAERPQDWQRLRSDRSLLEPAIEEVLRYRSPVQSMFRITKEPAELSGQHIPAGEPLVAWIGSANHDENQFSNPDAFDLSRSPNRHLAFGQGIHYCLGAPLARLEAKIALSQLLDRFESIRLKPDIELERHPSILVYGVKSLPLWVA